MCGGRAPEPVGKGCFAGLHEHAGRAVDNGFKRAAAAEGDHWAAARLRFERHNPEVLLAWKNRGDR